MHINQISNGLFLMEEKSNFFLCCLLCVFEVNVLQLFKHILSLERLSVVWFELELFMG